MRKLTNKEKQKILEIAEKWNESYLFTCSELKRSGLEYLIDRYRKFYDQNRGNIFYFSDNKPLSVNSYWDDTRKTMLVMFALLEEYTLD